MQDKISISISSNLLKLADGLVDSSLVRNRSQAFEKVLREYFAKGSISKAVILLGKATLIDEKVLRHYLDKLLEQSVHEVVIAAATHNSDVFAMLGSSYRGIRLSYLNEEKLLGNAGAIKSLEKDFTTTFLVVSGDIRFDFDLSKMLSFHREKCSTATMCLTSVDLDKSTDNIVFECDRVISFEYKGKTKTGLINAAIYLFEPAIFQHLQKVGSLERDIFPQLAKKGLLYGLVSNLSGWSQTC
ncbi:MAG: sugar phosphate nucleotidyltransferase [Candidatus Woesearchaeota archaeon]